MNKRTNEVYHFDKVYGDSICTREIFTSQVKEIVHSAMNGINQTIFVYG
jgi:hypothetical protein